MSVGFKYEPATKQWEHAKFRANRKYILRRPNTSDPRITRDSPWLWGEFGQRTLINVCQQDFLKVGNDLDVITCGSAFNRFTFNRKSMRFSALYDGGLIFGTDPGDTPSYEVGICSSL
jgi:hypothetical protein